MVKPPRWNRKYGREKEKERELVLAQQQEHPAAHRNMVVLPWPQWGLWTWGSFSLVHTLGTVVGRSEHRLFNPHLQAATAQYLIYAVEWVKTAWACFGARDISGNEGSFASFPAVLSWGWLARKLRAWMSSKSPQDWRQSLHHLFKRGWPTFLSSHKHP